MVPVSGLWLPFGRSGDLLPAGILSLEILTNLSVSIVVTCLSHSLLLSTHSLDTAVFSDLLTFYSIFLNTFVSFASTFVRFFIFFCVSTLVSSPYVIIGRSNGFNNVLYLYWWDYLCCPMHCDLFKIYCASPNLDITRTWICRLKFAQMPIFQAWCSWTSLKSQTRDPQLKVPPGWWWWWWW